MPSGQGVLEPSKSVVRLTSCFGRGNGTSTEHGSVAQLVAHLHGMQGVRGSSPLRSTRTKRLSRWEGLFSFLRVRVPRRRSRARSPRGDAFWGPNVGGGPQRVTSWWCGRRGHAPRTSRCRVLGSLRGRGPRTGRLYAVWRSRPRGALIDVSRSGGWAEVGAQDGAPRRGVAMNGPALRAVLLHPASLAGSCVRRGAGEGRQPRAGCSGAGLLEVSRSAARAGV